jgi:hypothetical protein
MDYRWVMGMVLWTMLGGPIFHRISVKPPDMTVAAHVQLRMLPVDRPDDGGE